jgi:hypothetical protein
MNFEERHNDSRRASATLAIHIDSACDRFEAEWRAGRRPRIEVHFHGTSGPEREALYRELLAIEVDWRRRLGERPGVDEYPGPARQTGGGTRTLPVTSSSVLRSDQPKHPGSNV